MATAFLFSPASMNAHQYDEATSRLEKAGYGHPKGRIFHSCVGAGDKLRVFDIWESKETFESFGPTLGPILQAVGVDPGQPEVMEVHSTIKT